MANKALTAYAVSEYFARVEALAKFAVGERVKFNAGYVHICSGATALIEKIDLDHNHGGSVSKPWWERHTEHCFTREHIEYSLVINPQPDGSADARWKARENEISG